MPNKHFHLSVEELLKKVQDGKLEIKDAIYKLKCLPYEDLGFAKTDGHRVLRQGFPEVIFCENKTTEHIIKIIGSLRKSGNVILATRVEPQVFLKIKKKYLNAKYNKAARAVSIQKTTIKKIGNILVVSAGTADIPVAEEAAFTAECMGGNVERLYDVGVAGIHRLLGEKEKIFKATAIIVVAGMEGALASVVGGLVSVPVIAVPTSIGYGASFKGVAALLSMLNSCSPNVSVVNIDNGFGAGFIASLINKNKL